jgi:hypothetical protein
METIQFKKAVGNWLYAAWGQYEKLFGQPPHGTGQQLLALTELKSDLLQAAVDIALTATEARVRADCAAELAANAKMLARQTDLAREAEIQLATRQRLGGELARLVKALSGVADEAYASRADVDAALAAWHAAASGATGGGA